MQGEVLRGFGWNFAGLTLIALIIMHACDSRRELLTYSGNY
jgi:hypothetical protein